MARPFSLEFVNETSEVFVLQVFTHLVLVATLPIGPKCSKSYAFDDEANIAIYMKMGERFAFVERQRHSVAGTFAFTEGTVETTKQLGFFVQVEL